MGTIDTLLNEIRFEMLKVILLNAFLDTAILFLALLLILSVFSIGLLIPSLIALLFLFGDIFRRWKHIDLRFIEERNPELREMLRTAADNKDDESLMAHALFSDLIKQARRVSSGTFLDMKQLSAKIGAMFVLSMIVVSLAFFNVNIQKFENPFVGLSEKYSGLFGGGDQTDPGLEEAGDIYGAPSIAKLGDEQIGIQLQQNLNQIDFNNVNEADPSQKELGDYPVEVGAQASEAYTDGLEDINDRKTAAEYSQEIKR